MSKENQLRQVLDSGIVAVVRSPDSQQLVEVVRALADGGVTVVEITMTVPGALDVLRQVQQALGDRVLLGAGTILDPETARAALLAGAEYLVVADAQPRRDPPVSALRQAGDARLLHADGDPRTPGKPGRTSSRCSPPRWWARPSSRRCAARCRRSA